MSLSGAASSLSQSRKAWDSASLSGGVAGLKGGVEDASDGVELRRERVGGRLVVDKE